MICAASERDPRASILSRQFSISASRRGGKVRRRTHHGMSAAARLRRLSEKDEIVVFERGSSVSFANCGLPYYIGGEIRDRDSLFLQTPDTFRTRFNVDVRTGHEVISIDRAAKILKVKDLIREGRR